MGRMASPTDLRQHWDTTYAASPIDCTGWYEAVPEESLKLIAHCGLNPSDRIADIGCGNSTLIPALIKRGFHNLVALDISQVALDSLRQRLGSDARHVRFIREDIARPGQLLQAGPLLLWHDRAMLHFLTSDADRTAYRAALEAVVAPGGHVILGEFATDGAEYCSGLPVHRYDETALDMFLGEEFVRDEATRYMHTQPSGGLRPYVYTLYHRVAR